MSKPIIIRPFASPDRAAVIALWSEVFGPASAWNQPEDVIDRKATVQPDMFFVAVCEDAFVGTIIAGFDGVRGWVHKLAVHPDFRRQGIASKLMRRAEAALKNAGCPKLNLQVRATNAGVVDFYESLGYETEDRISMGKPIA